MSVNGGYEYEGADILQLANVLPNYNRAIAVMACRHGVGAHDVLDFGAGIGTLSEAVRDLGLKPLCLEPDARQRDELVRRGFQAIASLADVPDASLDFIYSSNVLEHIDDDVATLIELRRKLRIGGRLFLYIPAFQALFSAMDRAVGHFRRYDRTMLDDKLRAAGFAVEDIYYADVLGYFVTRLFLAIGNDTNKINPFTLTVYDRAIFPIGQVIEKLMRVPVGKNIVGVACNTGATS
jgi:SAM-dependent methyltransferase